MEVFSKYTEIPANWVPLVLTIGKFDSVHRGHQALLKLAREVCSSLKGYLCVLTFINHPIEILKEGKVIPKLFSRIHNLQLLSQQGVDGVVLMEFTKSFSQLTAEEFVKMLYTHHPFKALILGYDSKLGKDRQGKGAGMTELSKKFHFDLHYADVYKHQESIVSSSLIRQAISKGNLHSVEKLLGRKYSILTFALKETPISIELQNLADLCLPPPGTYGTTVYCDGKKLIAKAIVRRDPPRIVLNLAEKKDFMVGSQGLEIIFNEKCML